MSSPMLNCTASASKGSFLRNGWYVAALSRDVGRDPKSVRICGEPVLLYRTEAGQAVALLDRCPHRLVPLSMGHVNGDAIQCAYHGITFDGTGMTDQPVAVTLYRDGLRRAVTVDADGRVNIGA